METTLGRIDSDELAADINTIAGPEFLSQIRHVNPIYERMVHGRLKCDDGSGQNLSNHVHAIQRAVTDYAIKVLATVDEHDEETIRVAQAALRPIETLRAQASRRGGAGEDAGGGAGGGTTENPKAPTDTVAPEGTDAEEAPEGDAEEEAPAAKGKAEKRGKRK